MLRLDKDFELKYDIYTKKVNQKEMECISFLNSIITAESCQGDVELEEAELGEDITEIGSGAFEGCTSLTTITFHESLHCIDFNAFANCTALQKIVFPKTLEEVVVRLDMRGVSEMSLFNPSSEELVENLKKGYAMDLVYKGEESGDHWA